MKHFWKGFLFGLFAGIASRSTSSSNNFYQQNNNQRNLNNNMNNNPVNRTADLPFNNTIPNTSHCNNNDFFNFNQHNECCHQRPVEYFPGQVNDSLNCNNSNSSCSCFGNCSCNNNF